MTNRFYDNTVDLMPLTRARSQAVEDNLNAVEAGFDLLQVEVDASMRAPDGETLSRLPASGARANKGLVFDGSGQPGVATLATQAEMDAAVQAATDAETALFNFVGQYLGPLSGDPTLDGNGNPVSSGDIYFNTSTQRLKVYTGAAWVNGVDTGGGVVPDTRLVSAGTGLTGGGSLAADRTISVATNGISNSLFRQGAATSIVGRSAGTTGDVADIAATLDGQYLRRSGGALAWGTPVQADVTGWLGFTPANAAGQTYTGTHSFATLQVSGNAVWHAGTFDKTLYALLASPTFTGAPKAPTPTFPDNSTNIATTAYVDSAVGASGFVPVSRTVTAGTGISGGGDLSANRSFAFDTTWGDARYATLSGATFTAAVITAASGAGGAGLRLPHGAAPSSPVNGDIWTTASDLLARITGVTRTFWHDGNLTPGNYVPTSRTVSTTAPISGGGALSGNLTLSLAANGVANSHLAQVASQTIKGRTTAATGNVEDLSVAQLNAMINSTVAPVFANVTSKPTTLSGYGITDGALNTRSISTTAPLSGGGNLTADRTLSISTNGITNSLMAQMAANTIKGNNTGVLANSADLTVAQLNAMINSTVAPVFSNITSKPTTIAGYGITDFNSLGDARWGQLSSANFTVLQRGGSNVWTEASLTNLNQLSNGPGYITSSALSPYAPLSSPTFSTATVTGAFWNHSYAGNGNQSVWYGNSTGSQYLFNSNNSWSCTGSWTATEFTLSSDETLKEEIEPIRDPLAIVHALDGIRFRYIKDGRRSLGFGARQTRKVLPELVYEGDDGKLTMTYGQITAVLNEAVKIIDKRLAAVEARRWQ